MWVPGQLSGAGFLLCPCWIQVIRLSSQCLYPMKHLSEPHFRLLHYNINFCNISYMVWAIWSCSRYKYIAHNNTEVSHLPSTLCPSFHPYLMNLSKFLLCSGHSIAGHRCYLQSSLFCFLLHLTSQALKSACCCLLLTSSLVQAMILFFLLVAIGPLLILLYSGASMIILMCKPDHVKA